MAECPTGVKPEPDVIAFAHESMVTGLEQVGFAMRRYSASSEFRAEAAGERGYSTPILADPAFRASIEAVASAIEERPAELGFSAGRVTAALRRLAAERNPANSRLVASLVATALRVCKKARA
jgi:hypothetical protein